MATWDAAWQNTLLDAGDTALIGVDLGGLTVFWSHGAERLFGWTTDEVLGRPPPIIPAALRQEWQLQMQQALGSQAAPGAAETQRLTRDGRTITVVRTSSRVFGADGRVVGLLDVLIDATELKQLDDESRAVAQVRERDLIAMDLHDGLVQSLYAVVLNLAAREQGLAAGDPDALHAVRSARAEVERVIGETRAYVSNLRARSITPPNLEAGVRLLVDSLRLNAGIDVALDFDPDVESSMAADVRGHVLFLVREAVSNVLRHASASHVTAELRRLPEAVVLRVEDDGRGFDPAAQLQISEPRNGLRNMAERARLIGARLNVDSAPGAGTRVWLELPL